MDMVFLLDSSSTIEQRDPSAWMNMLSFVVDMLSKIKIGDDGARVGVIRFSDSAQSMFYLNTYQDFDSVRSAIYAIPYIGGESNIALALRELRIGQFYFGNGDRMEVPNQAILITDGESIANQVNTVSEATAAKYLGINILPVGITNLVSESELSAIATGEYITVTEFNKLSDQVITVLDKVQNVLVVGPTPVESKYALIYN